MTSTANPSHADAVFVMGLPRSGSTLLSRLLNATPDILSVNDLYYLQAVLADDGADAELTTAQAARLCEQLRQTLHTRSSRNDEFIGQFSLPPGALEAIGEEVLRLPDARRWDSLLDAYLSRIATAAGKSRWADKTPQNFFHFDLLAARFPKARFVFLFRDPRAILASYKHARGEGHDNRRYHPIVYAMYWRSAVREYLRLRDNPRVTMVRYENLVHDTAAVCDALGHFLDTQITVPDLSRVGHNSSFASGNRQPLGETDAWLCERLCRHEMDAIDYAGAQAAPTLAGLTEVAGLSVRFAAFQASRLLVDRDARHRVAAFIGGLRS